MTKKSKTGKLPGFALARIAKKRGLRRTSTPVGIGVIPTGFFEAYVYSLFTIN